MDRIIILMPCIFFVLLTSVDAEDIYIYKDNKGNTVITNTTIPEKYKKKAKKIDSFREATPAEQSQRIKNEFKKPGTASHEAQSKKAYDPKRVEMEKRRLEADLKRLKNKESADSNTAQYYRWWIETCESNLQRLEKDPESYFKKQEQAEKEAAKLLR